MKERSASEGMITCVSFSPCTPTERDSCTDSFAYTPPLKLFREFCRFWILYLLRGALSGITVIVGHKLTILKKIVVIFLIILWYYYYRSYRHKPFYNLDIRFVWYFPPMPQAPLVIEVILSFGLCLMSLGHSPKNPSFVKDISWKLKLWESRRLAIF